MGYDALWEKLPGLVQGAADGQELFSLWMELADADFRTREEGLDDFLSADIREKLLKDITRNDKRIGLLLPNICTRNTRAVWLGLFEEARAKGYTLTTYASISKVSSTEDDEWECSADIYKGSYTPLVNLTRAHQKPDGSSKDTASIVYIMLPVVFLMSILVRAAHLPKLAGVEEFGVGWDDGDLLKWRR